MSDWTLDDALDDYTRTTPTEQPDDHTKHVHWAPTPNTPTYLPGSAPWRKHIALTFTIALEHEPTIPLPTPDDIKDALSVHRIASKHAHYTTNTYSPDTLQALAETTDNVDRANAVMRVFNKNMENITNAFQNFARAADGSGTGLMQTIPGTFAAKRDELNLEDAKYNYEQAKKRVHDLTTSTDATHLDRAQAALDLKLTKTHYDQLRRKNRPYR